MNSPKNPPSSKGECYNPRCKALSEKLVRGLCENCYRTLLRDVHYGLTTWGLLVRGGKCLPKRGENSREWLRGFKKP